MRYTDALRIQVLGLKNEGLSYGLCDCLVIQNYVVEAARQIVQPRRIVIEL